MNQAAITKAGAATAGPRAGTVARRFTIAFAAMFVIPTLLSVYLIVRFAGVGREDPYQLIAFAFFVLVLGGAGFLICRSVVLSLLRAARDAEAIAEGDLSHRVAADSADEISELARNFNRITNRLQQTVDSLQGSKRQIQTLLAQVCATVGKPVEMEKMFDVLLATLVQVTGLEQGAIFLMGADGRTLRATASVGLPDEDRGTVLEVGKGVVGWVASHGQIVTTSESMPWGPHETLSALERRMPWGIHMPLGSPGKIRGVMSIGMGGGRKDVSGEDLVLIQNLAAQVTVAIENAALKEDMERTYVETIAALAAAVEARDKYTRGHSKRVTEFALAIARKMDLPPAFRHDLEAAALLHDIGKIGIPDTILHNSGPLPAEGVKFIHGHPIGGENILKPVGSLGRLCTIVRHHHERYDGAGYPDRLAGEEIPLAARILTVADSFDAMISDRAYKATRTRPEATEELVRCKEAQFDPRCVDAFVLVLAENPEMGLLCPA